MANVKYINRCPYDKSPMVKAMRYAKNNGFILQREPFGERGSLIELYKKGETVMIEYRKSYTAILNLMKLHHAIDKQSKIINNMLGRDIFK